MGGSRLRKCLASFSPKKNAASGRSPLPKNHRDFLLELTKFDVDRGPDDFFNRIEYTDVTPHQVYSCGLGRLPESAQVAVRPFGYNAREHLQELIQSSEFQSELIERVLRSFPEKRRLFFVHVPKCAGSDLSAHLVRGYPYLMQLDQDPLILSSERMLSRLHTLMTKLISSDSIAITGHIGLSWILTSQLLRFGDAAFSIVRDPIDIAISKVNFVLTVFLTQPAVPSPFIVAWIKLLELEGIDRELNDADAKQCALRFLRDKKIVPPNNACRFLGLGDAESCLDHCASSNIELTTVSRYSAWLKTRWGIDSKTRVNESRKFISRSDLSSDDLAYLWDNTEQDRIIYHRVDSALEKSGKLSIHGAAL